MLAYTQTERVIAGRRVADNVRTNRRKTAPAVLDSRLLLLQLFRSFSAETYKLERSTRAPWRKAVHRRRKGAITSKIKHAIKLKTSPARLAQLLHNCCSPH